MKSAQDVEDLHHHVIVAALFRIAEGAFGLRCDAFVIGAREKYRHANAQRECRVRPVTRSLEIVE